ncbi:MAG: ATP-binding cassette domain-containing protein [Paracoccaceae bacterium]
MRAGKTTLLNIIGCIIDPSEGQVSLDGEMVYDSRWLRGDLRRLRLDKIGFIFQAHNLLPFLNATDNVTLVLQLAGKSRVQAQARALANSPRIILADEPAAALDSKCAGIVTDLMRKMAAEQDTCIIAVTPDEKILDRFDRLFHLRDGRLGDDKRDGK